jgi:signal transduction histidine kinase
VVAVSPGVPGQTAAGDGGQSIAQCEVYRIARGRITEMRLYADRSSPDDLEGDVIAEQSALRRVATLVAGGTPPREVFEAIVSEAAELFGTWIWLYRHDAEDELTLVAHRAHLAAGEPVLASHVPPGSPIDRARRSGRPVRVDPYSGPPTAVGVTACAVAPLVVQGRSWGGLAALTRGSPLEPGIEDRLARFAELAATAVANAESRAELERLADEQAALRRVAELVARGALTQDVFDQVTVEAGRLLDDAPTILFRYERSGSEVVVVARSLPTELERHETYYTVGASLPVPEGSGRARVWRTGRAVRIDSYAQEADTGVVAVGFAGSVSAPITVEGRVWGALTAGCPGSPLPAGTEGRLAQFAELVAAAIANTQSRAELTASRARVVASADEARRRLARDVHDGAQRRLVHALIAVKQARATLSENDTPAAELVEKTLRQTQGAYDELRELAHGILPAALEQGGLATAVEALVADIALAVQTDVIGSRLPETVETTAYFLVAEALTNAVKHADASQVRVRAVPAGRWLTVEVSDDGRGGARPDQGSGLVGLCDRVQAAGGTISVTSPRGAGTTVSATLPFTAPETDQSRPQKSG